MVLTNDYCSYLSKFINGETDCLFRGELSVLQVISTIGDELKEGQYYILDSYIEEELVLLLKIKYDRHSLRILTCHTFQHPVLQIAKALNIRNIEEAKSWWNLCYFRDNHNQIHYDPYYDVFFAANEVQATMSCAREALNEWFAKSIVVDEGIFLVLGDLAFFNPILYLLQQKCLEVKTLQIDEHGCLTNWEERLVQLRNQFSIPYCSHEIVKICTFNSEGVVFSPVECNHSYLIAIPIDLIGIDDKAIVEYTYKDILYNGVFCRDYSCYGHDYCLIEMEFYADLHGNTVLKTTNSMTESKYTIINRIDYKTIQ